MKRNASLKDMENKLSENGFERLTMKAAEDERYEIWGKENSGEIALVTGLKGGVGEKGVFDREMMKVSRVELVSVRDGWSALRTRYLSEHEVRTVSGGYKVMAQLSLVGPKDEILGTLDGFLGEDMKMERRWPASVQEDFSIPEVFYDTKPPYKEDGSSETNRENELNKNWKSLLRKLPAWARANVALGAPYYMAKGVPNLLEWGRQGSVGEYEWIKMIRGEPKRKDELVKKGGLLEMEDFPKGDKEDSLFMGATTIGKSHYKALEEIEILSKEELKKELGRRLPDGKVVGVKIFEMGILGNKSARKVLKRCAEKLNDEYPIGDKNNSILTVLIELGDSLGKKPLILKKVLKIASGLIHENGAGLLRDRMAWSFGMEVELLKLSKKAPREAQDVLWACLKEKNKDFEEESLISAMERRSSLIDVFHELHKDGKISDSGWKIGRWILKMVDSDGADNEKIAIFRGLIEKSIFNEEAGKTNVRNRSRI